MNKKSILILAIGFLPNIGGLETHLKDLIDELIIKEWKVVVLTYQPLHTPVLGKWVEKKGRLRVYRLPSLKGLFYKLLKTPILEFIFLEPLLFLTTSLILIMYPNIKIINGQGLIAGFTASFWAKVFNKRYVVSAQSVYKFPKKGLYRKICEWIFKSANKVVAISGQSAKSIEELGVPKRNIQIYTNWENSSFFIPMDKKMAKEKAGFSSNFVVSFFGRLVEEKGIKVLLKAIKLCDKKIFFAIYGEGPLVDEVLKISQEFKNVKYMKIIQPELLPLHYSAADLVIMPSLHEEGFGRVAAGALLCSTPVIASNKGALPDIVNNSVGEVINPTPENLAKVINFLYTHPKQLETKALRCREYALSKFSEKNAEEIITAYDFI